jgi:hypothetical protein
MHDERGQGRPSLVTDDLVQHVDKLVRERCRFTISELTLEFPQVSRRFCTKLSQKKLATTSFVPDGAQLPGGNFFDVGIQKLVSCYDKRLSSEGDYVKK